MHVPTKNMRKGKEGIWEEDEMCGYKITLNRIICTTDICIIQYFTFCKFDSFET